MYFTNTACNVNNRLLFEFYTYIFGTYLLGNSSGYAIQGIIEKKLCH